MNRTTEPIERRSFLKQSTACSAHLFALFALAPLKMRHVFQDTSKNEKLFEKEWGWMEKLSSNVWAHIASPFEQKDFSTVCNGGIIAGKDRVLVVESFQTPKGARWVAERAKELTGRWPTDIAVTHFHGDHVSGSKGFETDKQKPRMWVTKTTRDLIRKSQTARKESTLLDNLSLIKEGGATELDLGGLTVKVAPTSGHTPSDVMIEIVDPNILFCGDLFWNRLVPNYRDAKPSELKKSVANLARHEGSIYVPGHGPMANLRDLKLFQEFLDLIEDAARQAHSAGKEAAQAASEFKLTGKFKEWYVFANSVVPTAFGSWYRELN